jgi:hypothetical protein
MKKTILLFLLPIIFFSCGKTLTQNFDSPLNLNIEKLTENKIRISWDYSAQSTNITYVIARKVGEENWDEMFFESTDDSKSFIDDIQTSSYSIYSYKVKAHDNDNNTFSSFSIPTGYFSDQTQPTDLSITQVGQDSLKIQWSDNTIGEEGYRIDKRINNGNWIEKYKILPANSMIFEDKISELYQSIDYKIFSFVGNEVSLPQQGQFIPSFPAPTEIRLAQISQNMVQIEWQDNSQGEDGFAIERKIGKSNWVEIGRISGNETQYNNQLSIEAASLKYRVRAFSDTLYSAYSEIQSIQYNIEDVSSINLPYECYNQAKYNQYFFIADSYSGVKILDTTNPNNPLDVGNLDYSGRALDVMIHNNYLFVSNYNGGITVFDVSDIDNIVNLGSINTIGTPYDLKYYEDNNHNPYLLVASGEAGLLVINFNSEIPEESLIVGRKNTHGISYNLDVFNNFVFVADGSNGLLEMDISDTSNPIIVSENHDLGEVLSSKIFEDKICTSNGNLGWSILSLNNLETIENYSVAGYCNDILISSPFVYISDSSSGIKIFDIRDLANIYQSAEIEFDTSSRSISLNENYLYSLTDTQFSIIQVLP